MKQDYLTPGIWVIATVAAGYALHEGGGILAPFALAVFVWLVMEGTARTILRRAPMVPTWLGVSEILCEGFNMRMKERSHGPTQRPSCS